MVRLYFNPNEIWKIIRPIRNDFSFFFSFVASLSRRSNKIKLNDKWIIENCIVSLGCSIYRKVERMCRNKYCLVGYAILNILFKRFYTENNF